MIKQLLLINFILVEKAQITFSPHFNIVTGETGAGKTAIMEAISLALGARADHSLIRQGCERAIVEACFEISSCDLLHFLLKEAGIEFEPTDDLIIRREISQEGKNRTYINCQQVPLPFLQKVGKELIDFITQDSIHLLRTHEFQRSLVDLFGNLQEALSRFQYAYQREKNLSLKCNELQAKSIDQESKEEFLRFQVQEIESEPLKEGEDEELFQHYKRLIHHKEIAETLKEILALIADSPSAILMQLNRLQKKSDFLIKNDAKFQEPFSLIQQALISLQEAHFHFDSYLTSFDQTPENMEHIEKRLSHIAHLKKKYGKTIAEIEAMKNNLKNQLSELENLNFSFQEAEKELSSIETQTNAYAHQLTLERKKSAQLLETFLCSHLQSLNMSKAEIHIDITSQNRTSEGEDLIQFWLKANPGEQASSVRENSSSGELSRLFLALKLVLAEKNKTPTLIFDEIDANVGGKTATIIGKKLAELGKTRQVICITHFPQVAANASQHFSVLKMEKDGRSITEIRMLSSEEREEELLRMMGGKESLLFRDVL